MKKRKARNYGIFTVFLIAFLFITSLAIAGPGSKIPVKAKNTTEKKVAENVTDNKEKVETTTTKQKNKTTDDEKEKSVVKKKVEVITVPNKKIREDKTPTVQIEKTKVEPSHEKKNTTNPDKIYNNQQYHQNADKDVSSKNELIIHSKSIIDKNTGTDSDMIENYLKEKSHGIPSNYISPKLHFKVNRQLCNDNSTGSRLQAQKRTFIYLLYLKMKWSY